MDQASLLAAFPLPVANAAPASPVFANLISLMLSSQTAPPPSSLKTPAGSQATAASPAQIADAMIRSMLDGPLPGTAASGNSMPASTASVAIPNQALSLSDPPMVPKTADPVAAASATEDAPVQIPLTAGNANPPRGTTKPNPAAQAPHKQPRNVTDAPVANVTLVVTMPAAPAAVTPPAGPKSTAPAPVTRDSAASVATLPFAKNSVEAKVAFTAILTPATEAPALSASVAGPAVPTADPAGAGNSSTPAAQLAPATNPQPQAATAPQVVAVQAGGNAQPGGGASSQQESDSPETPARPAVLAAATKIKANVQQDENALPAPAPSGVAHMAAVPSFTSPPTDSTRTSAPAQSAATPYNATAEALRTTESNLAAGPPLRTGAAQEISIRIAPPDSPAVDVRVVERAGQVHVDVRTADSAMQTSLRQDLGTLTNSLERAGYHAETFTPSSTLGRAASSAQTGNHQQDPSQNRGGAGDFSGDRRQQQQKRSGAWPEESEE